VAAHDRASRRRLQTLVSLPYELSHTSIDNYLDVRQSFSAPTPQQVITDVVALTL